MSTDRESAPPNNLILALYRTGCCRIRSGLCRAFPLLFRRSIATSRARSSFNSFRRVFLTRACFIADPILDTGCVPGWLRVPVLTSDPVECPQHGRQERRLSPRRSLNATGWIRLDGSFAMRECRIVDVSVAGIRVATPFAGKLPETFMVLFSKCAQGHQVRMLWRRTNQIGAKFI